MGGLNPEIERCRREQARCREHILSGKPDSFGAWIGLQDWFREELILEEEYQSINRVPRDLTAYAAAGADIRAAILAAVRKYNLDYSELVAILAQEMLGWQKED